MAATNETRQEATGPPWPRRADRERLSKQHSVARETTDTRSDAPDKAFRWADIRQRHRDFELRKKEVASTRRSARAGIVVAIATSLTAIAASVAACSATEAVTTARDAIDRGTREARFAWAVGAIGGERAAERTAGIIMLRRNVEERLRTAADETARSDSVTLYELTLDVMESYLKSPSVADGTTGSGKSDSDHEYAANQLRLILGKDNRDTVVEFKPEHKIAIDLSRVRLYGKSWANVDFSWLATKSMPSIDLRGANLTNSRWGTAGLAYAKFECANLQNASFKGAEIDHSADSTRPARTDLREANLRHANLASADLRDADLANADLTGAYIEGAKLEGAIVAPGQLTSTFGRDANGLAPGAVPAAPYNKDRCIKQYFPKGP